jgi:hypothetical protein
MEFHTTPNSQPTSQESPTTRDYNPPTTIRRCLIERPLNSLGLDRLTISDGSKISHVQFDGEHRAKAITTQTEAA